MDPCDDLLGRLLEDYHRRVARGQRPHPEDFEEQAGDCFERFKEVLAQEQLLDHVLEGSRAERYPRTFGEYTLLELLGRGGIGNVYKAVHRPLSRTVALKVLQGGWADDPELAERFRRGARAAAQVEHDHVVRIYDVGIFEGRPYIGMTYVPGTNLNAVYRALRAVGPAPYTAAHHEVLDRHGIAGEGDDTAAFVRRMAAALAGPADALAAYHDAGVIHRDVKPANLLVDESGRLVLTDFDLARRLETNFKTHSGGALGTPGYMSPEQWDPMVDEVDNRADIYGLGCVLYEAVAQRTPFGETLDPGRLMKRMLTEPVPDPAVPELPPRARRVVFHALERRPEDRYQTASEFGADLRALSRGESVSARPVAWRKRAGRWIWRRKGPLGIAALLLLIPLLWLLRPAYVHCDPWPVATVYIDGERVGTSPLSWRLRPGSYEVRMEQAGCAPRSATVTLEAGESKPLNWRLEVVDRSDPAFLEAVLKRAGVRTRRGAAQRASFRDGVKLLFPRGAMRPSDLDAFTVQVKDVVAAELVVRDDAGQQIHHEGVRLVSGLYQVPMAKALQARLAVGNAYEWCLRRGDTDLACAKFHLVGETDRAMAERTVQQIEKDYPDAIVDRAALLRRVEIGLLLDEGLFAGAYRLAEQAGDDAMMAEVLGELGR